MDWVSHDKLSKYSIFLKFGNYKTLLHMQSWCQDCRILCPCYCGSSLGSLANQIQYFCRGFWKFTNSFLSEFPRFLHHKYSQTAIEITHPGRLIVKESLIYVAPSDNSSNSVSRHSATPDLDPATDSADSDSEIPAREEMGLLVILLWFDWGPSAPEINSTKNPKYSLI